MWNISGGKWPPCCVASSAREKAVSKGHLSYNSLDISIRIPQMDLPLDFSNVFISTKTLEQTNKQTNQPKEKFKELFMPQQVCGSDELHWIL